jgi:hypothetical protein
MSDDLDGYPGLYQAGYEAGKKAAIDECAKIAHEISLGISWGYSRKHCEHCRDGEIAANNTGVHILQALRRLEKAQSAADASPGDGRLPDTNKESGE